MRRPRPLCGALALLIRGSGAEFLRGDLLEEYCERLARGDSRRGAELAYLMNVLASLFRWWTPGARRLRRKNERDGSYDPSRTLRGQQWGGGMRNGLTGLRQSLRGLARRPGFTTLTVVTLALGIGATTGIVSVVDSVLLRPLSYENADRIVSAGVTFPGREWVSGVPDLQHLASASYLNFRYVRQRARAFDGLGGLHQMSGLLSDEVDGPRIVSIGAVTEDFFSVLGARPELGRLFLPEEYVQSSSVLLLSYASWASEYGSDPNVLGKSLPEGSPAARTVVGILARDFMAPEALTGVVRGAGEIETWIPLEVDNSRYGSRGNRSLALVGRLANGVTIEAARNEARRLGDELAREFPEGSVYPDGTHFGYGVNSLHSDTVGAAAQPLIIFLGAVGVLLAIAMLNAANLLLVRGLDRSTELSVRRALGAGQSSLIRQILTESVILSTFGGALGVGLAHVGVWIFLRFGPAIPRMAEVGVDARILAITVALSVGAGIVTGLAPILGLGKQDLTGRLRDGSHRGAPAGARLRSTLVTAQLALALVLTVGASLLLHSFVRLRLVDPGFEPEGLTAFAMPVKRPGPVWQTWDELITEVSVIPGIAAVGAASNLPFEDPNWAPWVRLAGDPPEQHRSGIAGYVITPGYLETAGIEIRRGRNFQRTDGPDTEQVMMVNEAFVRDHYPDGDPLGATMYLSPEGSWEPTRVVAVVADVIRTRTEDGFEPAVYVPHTQLDWPTPKVAVRSDTDPEVLTRQLRQAAARFSPVFPVRQMGPLSSRIRLVQTGPRFNAILLGSYAAVALLLSAVGLYGSLTHAVGRRTHELGIRMAIGADPGSIYTLVLRQGMAITIGGLLLGLAGSLALTRVLERYLYEVVPLDPTAFLVASISLGTAGLFAVLKPARRAARINVVDCLRAE